MFKYIAILLMFFGNASFAITNNKAFQKFEDQYNIGYAFTQGTLINGAHNTVSYNTQYINLELEHLFDIGIWFDVNFSMVTNYTQPDLGPLNGSSSRPFGQYPFMNGLTAKVGYAFPLLGQSLQIIPYVIFGRTANWSTSTVISNGMNSITTDYFYTGGLGGRLAYRINNAIMLYFDELYEYNWDNSAAVKDIQSAPVNYGKSFAATNYTFTTTLGAKFNVTDNLQLGVSGYWNNFQVQSNIAGIMYTPTNTFGSMLSVGLTY